MKSFYTKISLITIVIVLFVPQTIEPLLKFMKKNKNHGFLINNPNLHTHLCEHMILKLTNYFRMTQNAGIAFRVGSSFKEGLNPTCVFFV
jgi:hypothetical protein